MKRPVFDFEVTNDKNPLFWILVVLVAWTMPFVFGLVSVDALTEQFRELREMPLANPPTTPK